MYQWLIKVTHTKHATVHAHFMHQLIVLENGTNDMSIYSAINKENSPT